MKQQNTSAALGLVSFEQASEFAQIKRSRMYAMIRDGKFPAPVKVGRSSRWLRSELEAWIAALPRLGAAGE